MEMVTSIMCYSYIYSLCVLPIAVKLAIKRQGWGLKSGFVLDYEKRKSVFCHHLLAVLRKGVRICEWDNMMTLKL